MKSDFGEKIMKNISVAMAAYNGEVYIRKQLDSILSQLEENDELVISYDRSTDGTLDIIREYEKKYSQVKVVINATPGLFENFENAIRNCSKDYVFISDQDDIWHSEKRAEVLKKFEKTSADMVIHNGVHIDKDGKVISKDFFTEFNITSNIFRNFAKPRYSGCCIAFTKEFANIIVPIPKEIGAYDHWIGMTGQIFGKVVFMKKVLLYHRIHGDNYTTPTRKLSIVFKARMSLIWELIKRRKAISKREAK